ncbi:hypothetical protein BDN72DRAFT_800733 [Pluteus cervinus]|uniref:Uncharacterized protein n=1 Tax=Pluteus cervinus TaxID=181527 RepID=A0ACD3AK28_9AGAR|nr:hypothetical protein BDN72DRAFT_800733 [Pluteus cervinus]
MALRRSTRSVDGSIPVPALLYNDEELLASQDGVGIYDGSQKSTYHQNGGIHVTTHRLFYIDAQNELRYSFALDLSSITQTDYYAGLFTSSSKVTLHLSASESDTANGDNNGNNDGSSLSPFDTWECQVCAYRNAPGLSPAASRICGLCGVPRASIPQSSNSSNARASERPPPSTHHLSTSLPPTPPRPRSPPYASSPQFGSQGAASDDTSNSIACPACTFLNHPSLRTCEICSTELPKIRPTARSRLDMRSAPTSRPTSPVDDDESNITSWFIKISFRKGGDKAFYAVLKRSLKAKAWAISSGGAKPNSMTDSSATMTRESLARSGISGIMRTVEDNAQQRQTGISDALQDLEALMVKAKDMVRLAAELNEKLTNASKPRPSDALSVMSGFDSGASNASTYTLVGSTTTGTTIAMEPEEATFIRSSLSQLGLQMVNVPLTQDMVRDERKWIEELAVELANVLQGTTSTVGGLMKERPVIALDEVWGGWNRARGVALIPPSTFLQVLPYLPSHTAPSINTRTFPSGLTVLHTPAYRSHVFSERVCRSLRESGAGKSTMEVAFEEGMTVGLIGEMLGEVEREGGIVRDDGNMAIVGGGSGVGTGTALVSEELRWWVNVFVECVWDGYVHPMDEDI